ncbi:MAG: deoxyguanosinetriphosphate triphosphohydrolase [Gammaproteobacteria bacterium]|nr:MAG: deoxyguanosinetriphosphate triphosphohydrolase [Gammaproteobacteria bacterium]RKZ71531.1 MAG: deoxyguanosinetriphosphate triphosphohydrolase [Gammaproteobacteria bacterium]
MKLACYAASEENSLGREFRESEPSHRNQFQRDRDRVVHSSAFRRLEYKTQVFVNHVGDMFRTRLTHSIEVAQIGRTISRSLQLNEDLTEAVCLAHDLGHTPFGHAGQDELNLCMKEFGGFEHNLQSLRVVDVLEEKYAEFTGLNLMYETREGILKHCSRSKAKELGAIGQRFLDNLQPGLEAQVADIADQIAYNNHDVDDGLRAGLISFDQLAECELFSRELMIVTEKYPMLSDKRMIHEVIRRMINTLVSDLISNSQENIDSLNPLTIDDVRGAGRPLVKLSESVAKQNLELKRFLNKHLYKHDKVEKMSADAKQVIRQLFDGFMSEQTLLPEDVQKSIVNYEKEQGTSGKARVIADYIAGMTDRFAFAESERISE